MDRDTVDVYERGAERYRSERRAVDADAAEAMAAAVTPGAVRADVGCGPGLYIPHLGQPLLALDASLAMVELVDGAWRVCADLEALPVRSGALGGAWASRCYQHVAHEDLPEALADLHRACAVDATVALTLFTGDQTVITSDGDAFPGRRFSLWPLDALVDVAIGAGFEVVDIVEVDADWPFARLLLRRLRTLPDHVGGHMRLLVCGLNPSLYAADHGVNFARPGNRFWPALLASGLVSVDRDPSHALRHHGIGMTDLVKRATVAASELTADEYVAGIARLERLCEWLRPAAVCMVGLSGWRAAVDRKATTGWQPRDLSGAPVYVMPNTSGLNASTQLDGFVTHLRTAARS